MYIPRKKADFTITHRTKICSETDSISTTHEQSDDRSTHRIKYPGCQIPPDMKEKRLQSYIPTAHRGETREMPHGPTSSCKMIVLYEKTQGIVNLRPNNQAEYAAVIHALADAADEGYRDITLYSDSELVIRQLRGEYKVRDPLPQAPVYQNNGNHQQIRFHILQKCAALRQTHHYRRPHVQ